MRNEQVAMHEDNRMASEYNAPSSHDNSVLGSSDLNPLVNETVIISEVWTGQFAADFSKEELFFMLEVAALFPSEREFVALLGGDAAAVWDLDPEDEAPSQQASLEERTTASVFERLNLPSPPKKSRKK